MRRRVAATILILAIFIIMIAGYTVWNIPQPRETLDPVPPPDESPGYYVDPVVEDSLIMNASVDEFFVIIPHQGSSHFSFELKVNVTNMGENHVDDFHTLKATVYRKNLTQIHTFDMSSKQNKSISAGSSKILSYDVGADIEGNLYDFGSIELFLRLLVTFNSTSDAIITSPLAPLSTAIE